MTKPKNMKTQQKTDLFREPIFVERYFMLRFAVVGASGYAYTHIQNLWFLKNICKLVAVTSSPTRKSVGADECRKRGIIVYDNVDEMLNNIQGKCDVVIVPTPIHTHFEITKKCVEAGFDVFLEKPPVATIQELDELDKYVKKAGKSVAVCFQLIFSDVIQRLKCSISRGEFGKVIRIKGVSAWPRLDSYYSRAPWAGKIKVNDTWVLDGTINNPMGHVVANQLYLASQTLFYMAKPVSVQAELYHAHKIDSEDTSSLRIITEDKVEIILNTTLCPTQIILPTMIIETEKATIECSGFTKVVIRHRNGIQNEFEDKIDPTVQGVIMLKQLINAFKHKKDYLVTLETCRPFVVAINGAFESSNFTHSIESKYIERFQEDDSVRTVIKDINTILLKAYNNNKLLSELNVPWAVKTDLVDVTRYTQFPSCEISEVLKE